MKKQSIYFLVIIILLVQTSCQQNNEEEDFFNNQITLLENNPRLYLSKIEVNFLTSGNKHKLELGLGSNLGIYNEHISFIEESKEQYETISSTSNTTFGYYFFSNIGYRYISTKGFLFRIGLSPSFSFNDKHGITKEPFIYPYISFGYSF